MAKEVKIIVSADSTGVNGPLDLAASTLEKFGKKAESIGRSMEGLGTRIAGLGAAVQGGLGQVGLDLPSVSRAAVDAEKALYGIANTAGLAGDKARAAVGEWSGAINQIALQTNKAQAEVITAFNDLVAKGISEQDALRMLAPIGKAATAAGADIKDMASAANAAFQNLGIAPEKLAQSLDIMAQAGKSGAFELRDMAQYFDLLTVKSALLGAKGPQALSQLAAAAQIARKGAGDAGSAANNLANFLDKLSSPATANNFEKFGLNLAEEVKKGLASGDLIGYMGELVLKVSGGDASKVSALFTDVQAKNFIAPLIQNLEEYKRIRDDAFGATGVIDQDFQTAMQSMSATFDQFKIAGQSAMGGSEAVSGLLSSLKDLAAWAAEHPDIVAMIGIGSAAAVVGGGVIVGVGAVVTAIGTITTALSGLAAFLAANPVVLTVLGVAAAGAAGYAFGKYIGLDEVGKKLGSATYDMVQALKKGLESVKATLGEWQKIGADLMTGLLKGIQAKYREIIDRIKGLGKDMLDSIKDVLGIKSPSKEFQEIGEMAGEGMKLGLEAMVPAVSSAAETLGEAATNSASGRPRNADGTFKAFADSSRTVLDQVRDATTRAFQGMDEALVSFVRKGKLDFRSLADSIISDILRIGIQQSITQPLGDFFGGLLGGLFATGGVPGGHGLHAYANQVVNRPTVFPFASGVGLMGEAGPEAILPLRRGPGGRLGVESGAGGVTVNVINTAAGTQATAHERTDAGGNRIVDVVIEQVKAAIAGDITRGSGPIPGALAGTYGLNRVAGAY